MYFLYNLLLFFSLPLLLFSPRKRLPSFLARLGFFTLGTLKKPVWVHAVSAGEVLSVKTLIAEWKARFPEEQIVLSTITATGQRVAPKGSGIDALIYFPFDFPFAVARVLNQVDPRLVIVAETEIWPNFLLACHKRSVPVFWINGRISDKSYPRYRLIQGFLKKVFSHYAAIGMQSEADCRRVISLGADPAKVFSMGNLKYDIDLSKTVLPERLQKQLAALQPLWIAASTMPSEEGFVLESFRQLRERHPDLTLMIAPRHPERFDEVARLIQKSGFQCLRRSQMEKGAEGISPPSPPYQGGQNANAPVFLLDSLGELAATFAFADLVFVGGSLVPHGGHNILEPAFFSKPILFGPHMENFREISSRFLEAGAAIAVQSPDRLAAEAHTVLTTPSLAASLGRNAKQIVASNRGATMRVIDLVQEAVERECA
jgi:3-deoxy-D-manno-octulosonic-acid transferase